MQENRGLKIMVISLGILLIGGGILFVALLSIKIIDKKSCGGSREILLEKYGKIQYFYMDKNITRFFVKGRRGGGDIIAIDNCTGKIKQKFSIKFPVN